MFGKKKRMREEQERRERQEFKDDIKLLAATAFIEIMGKKLDKWTKEWDDEMDDWK